MITIRKIEIDGGEVITVSPDDDDKTWVKITVDDSSAIFFHPKYAKEVSEAIKLCGEELSK